MGTKLGKPRQGSCFSGKGENSYVEFWMRWEAMLCPEYGGEAGVLWLEVG